MEMIRLEHVTKSFGEHTVLDDFSISIPEGEFLTVIGRSGCGKTTMLKMINGLNCPGFKNHPTLLTKHSNLII